MTKRIIPLVLLVCALSIAPVAAAAPADLGADTGDPVGLVQALWDELARFLGIGPESSRPDSDDRGEPRSVGAANDTGPTIDP